MGSEELAVMLKDAPMDALCDLYVKYRDEKSGLAQQIKEIDNDMSVIEALLVGNLQKMGVESAATSKGTAYITEKVYYKITDWPGYFEFAKQAGEAFLQKRVGSNAVKEFKDQNGQLPPGLEEVAEISVNVRRS